MAKFRVFYTVSYDGFLEIEADSPADALRDFRDGLADDELVDNAERDDLKINDIQDPDSGGSYPQSDWED